MPGGSVEEKVKSWLQIIGIVGGAMWAIYTFVYQESIKPQLLPSYIKPMVNLSSIGIKKSMIGIKALIAVENTSKRSVFVLPSSYVVFGARNEFVKDEATMKDLEVDNKTENFFIDTSEGTKNISGSIVNKEIAVTGTIFNVFELNPGEKISKTIIFFLQKNKYDYLEIKCFFAVSNDHLDINDAEWHVFKSGDFDSVKFRAKDEKTLTDEIINYYDPLALDHELGILSTNDVYSLIDL